MAGFMDSLSSFLANQEQVSPGQTPPVQQPWYNNPGFWSLIGKFGAAIAPKDSWQARLGEAASQTLQARQYGAGLNKTVGPMVAGLQQATPATGIEALPSLLAQGAGTSASTSGGGGGGGVVTSEDLSTSSLGTVAPNRITGREANPFNVPFQEGPSTPILSDMEMMGLSADQIKDIFESAVGVAKFPLEVEKTRTSIDYTKQMAEYNKQLAEEAKRKRELADIHRSNVKSVLEGWRSGTIKKPAIIGDDLLPILDAMEPDAASSLISDLAKSAAKTDRKVTYHFNDKAGKGFAIDSETNMPMTDSEGNPIFFDIPKTPQSTEEKLPSTGWSKEAMSTAVMQYLPDIEADFAKTLGDKAAARKKMQDIMAVIGDPNKKADEIVSILGSSSQGMKNKVISYRNKVLDYITKNKGAIPIFGETPKSGSKLGSLTEGMNPDEVQITYTINSLAARLGREPTAKEIQEALSKAGFKSVYEGTESSTPTGKIYGWRGRGYYMVNGKKTLISTESEYRKLAGGK